MCDVSSHVLKVVTPELRENTRRLHKTKKTTAKTGGLSEGKDIRKAEGEENWERKWQQQRAM